MSAPKSGKATRTFSVDDNMKAGLGILAVEEWFKLQAFCDMASNDYPSTDKAMHKVLGIPDTTALDSDFKDTVGLYSALKGYCSVFNDEIRPGTIELAGDIVQYNRRVGVIYPRLIAALSAFSQTGDVKAALVDLAKQWGSGAPSPAADSVKQQFIRYVGMLQKDAVDREASATKLKTKLTDFQSNLKASHGAFEVHAADYSSKYASASKDLQDANDKISDLNDKLAAMRKKHHDEELVLETSPLYLIIPIFGPFIMAGVLIGVGTDYGLDVENLKGEVKKLELAESQLTTAQSFYDRYQAAKNKTKQTVDDITGVLPLVAKLALAWSAIASDLTDLVKVMEQADKDVLTSDWDFTSIDLEIAQNTWADLAVQADQYRRFGVAEKAIDVDHLALGMLAA